jgi:hypothetical protein
MVVRPACCRGLSHIWRVSGQAWPLVAACGSTHAREKVLQDVEKLDLLHTCTRGSQVRQETARLWASASSLHDHATLG